MEINMAIADSFVWLIVAVGILEDLLYTRQQHRNRGVILMCSMAVGFFLGYHLPIKIDNGHVLLERVRKWHIF